MDESVFCVEVAEGESFRERGRWWRGEDFVVVGVGVGVGGHDLFIVVVEMIFIRVLVGER